MGWMTDNVITFLSSFIIIFVASMVFVLATMAHGGSPNQITSEQIQQQFESSLIVLIMECVVGLLSTMVGGFVSAYLAKGYEIKHSFAMGSLSFATGILIARVYPQPVPHWYNLWAGGLTIPFAILGGFIRLKTKTIFLK